MLELIRRIDIECDPNIYEKLKQDSKRPRFYSLLLLSTCGMLINLALSNSILQGRPIAMILAALYHMLFAMVFKHDSEVRNDRAIRHYNENRYFGKSSCEASLYNHRIIAQQSVPRSYVRYRASMWLYTAWMAWPLIITLYNHSPGSRLSKTAILFLYPYCIYSIASDFLFPLKFNRQPFDLRQREYVGRTATAYSILEKGWQALSSDPAYEISEPVIRLKKKDKFLSSMIEYIEASREPCGKQDMDMMIRMWLRNHPGPVQRLQRIAERSVILLCGLELFRRFYLGDLNENSNRNLDWIDVSFMLLMILFWYSYVGFSGVSTEEFLPWWGIKL